MGPFRLGTCSTSSRGSIALLLPRSCLNALLAFSVLIAFGAVVITLNHYVFCDKTTTATANIVVINATPFNNDPASPGHEHYKNVSHAESSVARSKDNLKSFHAAAVTADGPNGFHDKINTSNEHNDFDSITTNTTGIITTTTTTTTTTTYLRPSANEEFAERVVLQESKLWPSYRQQQLLLPHRNKRYIVFPESSSFQLIFDLIIGIVDYSSFAILGITCAVAWELPSKPPSEILQDLQIRLNDGTLGISRRNDSTQQQLEYVTTQEAASEVRNQNKAKDNAAGHTASVVVHPWWHQHSNELNRFGVLDSGVSAGRVPPTLLPHSVYRPYNYFYAGDTFGYHADSEKNDHKTLRPLSKDNFRNGKLKASWFEKKNPPTSFNEYGPNRLATNRWWEGERHRWQSDRQTQRGAGQRPGRMRQILNEPPTYHVYPVFGKRRKRRRATHNDFDLKLHQVNRREHLRTRQLLFGKIEKLFKVRGHNGTECVLRALCETSERSNAIEPRSFLLELLRAVFTLPQDLQAGAREIATHYRDAHAQATDCALRYALCPHSIWSDSPFGVKL